MIRLKWRAGPLGDWPGPFLVNTTRFTYRSLHRMPQVYWHGLRLRRSWSLVEGAVGPLDHVGSGYEDDLHSLGMAQRGGLASLGAITGSCAADA